MRKWIFGIITVIIIILISGGIFYFVQLRRASHQPFPSEITSNLPFNLYFFDGDAPNNFKLDKTKTNYNDGVLIFKMVNSSGKSLVFTEQKLPSSYDYNQLRADKEFSTQSGKAYITDGQLRTTGALFTNDKTWILVNAPDPIGSDSMQQILGGLVLVN